MQATLTQHPHLLNALDGALALYDRRTAEHARRVRSLAARIGDYLGVDEPRRSALRLAALLHDLGKLGVPQSILAKPGPLTAEEWDEIKRHPITGAEIVVAISPAFEPIADGIRAHHERWDGTGYPFGLAGEQIPYIARIITIADVYDSLTHPRRYRKGIYQSSEAAELITDGSGSQFDPIAVQAFLAMRTHRDSR